MMSKPVPTAPQKPAEESGSATDSAPKGAESGTYTPPASQADLDRIIADRVARERAKYADYDDLKGAAQRLADLEREQMTEAEKVAERLAALEAENAAFKQREQIVEWANEIARDSHVPADLLRGSTQEELQAHHDQLAQIISKPDDTPAPTPFSGPTLLGIEPTGTGEAPLDAQIAAAEKEGNWVVAGQLKAMKLAQGQSTP